MKKMKFQKFGLLPETEIFSWRHPSTEKETEKLFQKYNGKIPAANGEKIEKKELYDFLFNPKMEIAVDGEQALKWYVCPNCSSLVFAAENGAGLTCGSCGCHGEKE